MSSKFTGLFISRIKISQLCKNVRLGELHDWQKVTSYKIEILGFEKENKFQTAATICQRRFSNSLLIAETLLKVNVLGFSFKSNGCCLFITGEGLILMSPSESFLRDRGCGS